MVQLTYPRKRRTWKPAFLPLQIGYGLRKRRTRRKKYKFCKKCRK